MAIEIIKQGVELNGSRIWNMQVNIYTKSQQVIRSNNCFAFMFTNLGDTIAFVNGIVVFPSPTPATALGDARSLTGHILDLYKGNLTLAFAVPLGANPKVEIIQLFYEDQIIKDKK
jgi:hypothetical protein